MRNLFLAALFLLSCATAPRLREDRGFMKTATAIDLHWELTDLPVQVQTSPDFPPEAVALLDELTAELNQRIGTMVFDRSFMASDAEQTRVEVASLAPIAGTIYVYRAQFWNGREHTADTVTRYDGDGKITSATIRVPDEPDESFGAPILRHELGHALGLDHDDQGLSIMSPETGADQHFTEHDIAILRQRYRTF